MTSSIPVSMPEDLLHEIETAASDTGLSRQDVIRQSTKLGIPKLREQLSKPGGRITNIDPLPPAVAKRLYAERDDDEESIRLFMAAQSKSVEE